MIVDIALGIVLGAIFLVILIFLSVVTFGVVPLLILSGLVWYALLTPQQEDYLEHTVKYCRGSTWKQETCYPWRIFSHTNALEKAQEGK